MTIYRIVPSDNGFRLELNFAPHTLIKESADEGELCTLRRAMGDDIATTSNEELESAAELWDNWALR